MIKHFRQRYHQHHLFKKWAKHRIFRRPWLNLANSSFWAWVLGWVLLALLGAIAQTPLQYSLIATAFGVSLILGGFYNLIQLELLQRAYPKDQFKGLGLTNLLTHYLSGTIIGIVDVIILLGVSAVDYYVWNSPWCLGLGFGLLLFVTWGLHNIYRFANYETMFHLSDPLEALQRSRRFAFHHLPALLWLNVSMLGHWLLIFITWGLWIPYYHLYQTLVYLRFFQWYHRPN